MIHASTARGILLGGAAAGAWPLAARSRSQQASQTLLNDIPI
jgi:hypothetical protein